MITRAGIVGPSSTVKMVVELAEDYKDRLQVIPYIYKSPEETTAIIQQKQSEVDIWVLGGPVLYPFVRASGSNQPFFFLQLDGASLTKAMIEIGYSDQRHLQNMSIDIIPKRDVYETFEDLNLSSQSIYSQEFHEGISIEELLDFHKKLYKENKVDTCLTCLYAIFENLQSEDIPSYWITPTRTNIRETLTNAIQYWETKYFKESQISVILIKVTDGGENDILTLSYNQYRLNLQLQSVIVNFSESLSGSIVNLGMGSFIIFSTRGSLQESSEHVADLLDKVSIVTDYPTHIGIGYGDTALAAEKHARIALLNAQTYASFCAFLVDDQGMIEGPLQEQESISFSYRIEDREMSGKLKLCGVTITTFNKILSVQKRTGNHSITASLLSEWLKMTPRNARRILNNLVEQDMAEIIGEEAPISKGRPRKIYRINSM